jgi:hypothetical protein
MEDLLSSCLKGKCKNSVNNLDSWALVVTQELLLVIEYSDMELVAVRVDDQYVSCI